MKRMFVYFLIGLAIVGLGSQLIFNSSQLIKTIAFFAVGAIVLYFVARFIFSRQANTGEMRKYKQAVKQSQMKYQQSAAKPHQPRQRKPLRRRAPHLRVINGRKPK